FYQEFTTKGKLGDCKLTAKLYLNNKNDANTNYLTKILNIHLVSDAKVQPDQLTIFNHPSNVISLSVLRGSGYYHAEIETIRVNALLAIADLLRSSTDDAHHPMNNAGAGHVRSISHITDSTVVVGPDRANGLALLHLFDYCVPPVKLDSVI